MAYEMVMPYHLHMPSYFLETFTEYPYLRSEIRENHSLQDININVLPVIVKLYLYLIKMNLYVLALLSAKLINRLRRK